MVIMGHGREIPVYYLLKSNARFGISAIILFSWFTAFGCQSRSEAGSLGVMFAVFIGWGIVMFWSTICEVEWAMYFIPYAIIKNALAQEGVAMQILSILFMTQGVCIALVLWIASYRYVSIRRYL